MSAPSYAGADRVLLALRDWLWASRLLRLHELDFLDANMALPIQPGWAGRSDWPKVVARLRDVEAAERKARRRRVKRKLDGGSR